MRNLWFNLCSAVFVATIFVGMNIACASTIQVNKIGKGKPILLIPGLMCDERVWVDLIPALTKQYELHLVNIAGMANDLANTATLAAVVDDISLYIKDKQLNDYIVIGHSLGGFLAYRLAISQPEKIRGIISIDGLPYIGPVFTRSNLAGPKQLEPLAKQLNSTFKKMNSAQLRNYVAQGLGFQAKNKNYHDLILTMAEASDPEIVAEFLSNLLATDLRSKLTKIIPPVLVLGASGASRTEIEHKKVKQIFSEQLATVPQATIKMNQNAHHFIMFDDPAWLTKQVHQFIDEVLQ